jgi:hypothetical protein
LDHLPDSVQPTSTPSFLSTVQSKPSPPTNLPSEPQVHGQSNFFSVATAEDPTASIRPDAFYVRPEHQRFTNVIFAFNTCTAFTHPTTTGTDKKSEQLPIETLFISARLMFPVRDGNIAEWEWWNQERRDEAARWINTNLSRLYSRGTLSGCMAGRNFWTQSSLMRGSGTSFRLELGTLLRGKTLVPTRDDPLCLTSGPSTYESLTPDGALVKVGSETFPLVIREGNRDPHPSVWEDGQFYSDPDILLKPLTARQKSEVTLEPDRMKGFQKSILESIKTQSHISDKIRCIFGDVVLCGPDAPSTVATSSTTASSSTAAAK